MEGAWKAVLALVALDLASIAKSCSHNDHVHIALQFCGRGLRPRVAFLSSRSPPASAPGQVITGPAKWFEQHIDFLSVQATMFGDATTFKGRMATHISFYANNKKSG